MLLVIVTKFDLEMLQLHAIKAFVYADLNETVFIYLLLGYIKLEKILRLNKGSMVLNSLPILGKKCLQVS